MEFFGNFGVLQVANGVQEMCEWSQVIFHKAGPCLPMRKLANFASTLTAELLRLYGADNTHPTIPGGFFNSQNL